MATLQKVGEKKISPITGERLTIGRAPDNEIVLVDTTVSNHHAVIVRFISNAEQTEFYIEDLVSTNHTYVNNKEVSRRQLQEGDIIRIGTTRLKFSLKNNAAAKPEPQKTQKINATQISDYLVTK